jgi:dTDP-glucose 4,6-dehydratase
MQLRQSLPTTDIQEIVKRLQGVAPDLANSKILISGGTGFIGSWLTNAIIALDHEYKLKIELLLPTRNVKNAKNKFEIFNESNLNFFEIDYANEWKLPKLEISHLIYSSTPSQPATGGSNAQLVEKVAKNSFNALVEVSKFQKTPPIFCNLSSGAVYGQKILNAGKVEETGLPDGPSPLELNNYGKIKFELEKEVEKLTIGGQIRGSNPRLFTFSGPGLSLNAHFAIGNFMNDALKGKEIHIRGNPNTIRSYLYPTDLIVWLVNSLVKPTLNPIHIGSEGLISILGLAEKISEIFSSPSVSRGDDSSELSIYAPDTSKTRSFLNVSEEVSLNESLMRWKNWLISQPRN